MRACSDAWAGKARCLRLLEQVAQLTRCLTLTLGLVFPVIAFPLELFPLGSDLIDQPLEAFDSGAGDRHLFCGLTDSVNRACRSGRSLRRRRSAVSVAFLLEILWSFACVYYLQAAYVDSILLG